MDRMPAAFDGPRFEMARIGRTLDDLGPADVARPADEITPVIWTAIGAFALIALVGALLAL
jgi:hypothetical protein